MAVCAPSAIEERLVREGLIDESQLARAQRVASKVGGERSVVEVLIELNQLTRTDYDRIVREHRAQLSLIELLHEDGVADQDGIALYNQLKAQDPTRSERHLLVEQGIVSEKDYIAAVAAKYDIPAVTPEVGLVDRQVLGRTSIPYLKRIRVMPLRITDGVLTAIMADPLDEQAKLEVKRIFNAEIQPCAALGSEIDEALETLSSLSSGGGPAAATKLQYRELGQTVDDDETGEGAVQIVDHLLTRAIDLRASDLHIEPLSNKVRVRVRVDGVLGKLTDLPADFAPQLISRVKILARADIAERRLHQDGRIFVKHGGRDIDIRVSTYAGVHGETIVMRLLDRNRGLLALDQLGFEPRVLADMKEIVLQTSTGLVLVTGPTGSGKTTSLYSFVDYVNSDELKVISAEDPVEYVLEGVTQCSVNNKTGPTFADSLRAILRQDPDIIVVGEVRDGVTAGLAVEAALTGHKVFSTLHTEDSAGAVTRICDMGVEPFLAASTISGVIAQRLVRGLCGHCKRAVKPDREAMRFLSLSAADFEGIAVYDGEGCDQCNQTGYSGRLGVHEVLIPTDAMREAMLAQASTAELRQVARQHPSFMTLQENGLLKVMAGKTSIREVVARLPRDEAGRTPRQLLEYLPRGGRK